ncbi:hypothetical protein AQUCO_09500033v1 [Aquilegia coerulea]|uniref:Proton pump-interactor 1 n=1 Tax=Aquilegia coerulea TaxID=218851 RepID=A0A2G5C4T1_AQUCA|nr:hypothetical protein AQUCO_09500033v1 [Aquilegia coerulea]
MATDLDEHPSLVITQEDEIAEEAANKDIHLDAKTDDIHHLLNKEEEKEEEVPEQDPSPQVVVGASADGDCNGIVVHHDHDLLQETKEHVDDAGADPDASSYVIVDAADPMSDHPCTTTDGSLQDELQQPVPTSTEIKPDSPIEDKTDEDVVQVVERQQNNATTFSDHSHLQVDATAEEPSKSEIQEEQSQIETNATIEEKDSLGSDVVLIEDIREPTIEVADIVQPQLLQPACEEKVQEEKTLPQVEPNSDQLTRPEDKADDQPILVCESESKEIQELDPETEVADSVEPQLLQPCDGENTNQLAASKEAEVIQNSVVPVVESPEPKPHLLNNDENIEEESKLELSEEACHTTQITATPSIETETYRTDDEKECETETLADEIPVDEPSTHLETENLNSGTVNSPSDDVQVEIAAANDTTDEIGESLIASPVEQTLLKTEVISDSATGQESNSLSSTSNIETEPPNVNGHVERTESPSLTVEVELETDAENASAENGEGLLVGPVSCVDLEPEVVEVSIERDESISKISVDDVKPDTQLGNGSSEVNQSILDVPAHDLEGETDGTNGIAESTNLPAERVDDSQSEPWGGNDSPPSKEELSNTSAAELDSLVSKGPAANSERNSEGFNDVKSIENEGDQSLHEDNNGKSICEGDGIERSVSNGSPVPSPEDSAVEPLEGTNVECEVESRPFQYLLRIPRYSDDKLKNQIELAQKQVEERTQNRDDIRSKIQSMRASYAESRDQFDAARSEERAARDALNAKRREMDSVQSVINRMKNATSIEDIHDRVRSMEHRIEHETVPLKEEKQLIREIKQLKIHREQLSSSLGQQGELQPTPEEKAKIEDRFKVLKQEMDSCRKEVIRLEGITKAAWKINNDENDKQRELQAQFRAADDLRQEAYIHLQNLKKQLYEKNKYFRMYKEDSKKAEDCAFARDKEAVHHLCFNQVETMIELWNKNDEFRKDYIRCNTLSTLRRLRTLDGRALGPDEEPPLLYHAPEGRVVTVSGREEKQENEEENKKTKEEEELARKAEEMRRKEEAAKLKEQRRLEEKAKAKEAEERKRRNAEKAQARAELRAQKEAELKEKEREKKARKKERKKEKVEAVSGGNEEEAVSRESTQPEIIQEPEIKEKPKTVVKRPQKPSILTKPKVVPPPLRNRGKKRMQQWMWILLVVAVVVALFLVGNIGFSFKFGLPSFGL